MEAKHANEHRRTGRFGRVEGSVRFNKLVLVWEAVTQGGESAILCISKHLLGYRRGTSTNNFFSRMAEEKFWNERSHDPFVIKKKITN